MHILDDTLAARSLAMARLAKAAYRDDCSDAFAEIGLGAYKLISEDDASAHVASDDRVTVISIRGTEFTHLKDLLANAKAWPKSQGNGWIHAGFREYARKIYLQIRAYVEARPGRQVIITGHSLGAAMGLYTAGELINDLGADVTLFSYGMPRVGNSKYIKSLRFHHHRFVNCNDLVPKLPPTWLFYRHHGTLHYFDHQGQLRRYTLWQMFKDHLRSNIYSIIDGYPLDGLRDHNMKEYIKLLSKTSHIDEDGIPAPPVPILLP